MTDAHFFRGNGETCSTCGLYLHAPIHATGAALANTMAAERLSNRIMGPKELGYDPQETWIDGASAEELRSGLLVCRRNWEDLHAEYTSTLTTLTAERDEWVERAGKAEARFPEQNSALLSEILHLRLERDILKRALDDEKAISARRLRILEETLADVKLLRQLMEKDRDICDTLKRRVEELETRP